MKKLNLDYVETPRDIDPLIVVKGSTFHFEYQDFSMNQVYYLNGELLATKQAVHDLKYGVIRLTDYEKMKWSESDNGPKMLMKMIRLWARWKVNQVDATLSGMDELNFGVIPFFWIHLNAIKADEEGNNVASAFWQKIIDKTRSGENDFSMPLEFMEMNFLMMKGFRVLLAQL